MVFQLAIIGDACSGKTTYKRYLQDGPEFNFLAYKKHLPTNYEKNFNNNFEKIHVDNIEVEIMDAPGQSLYLDQTKRLLYSANGVIIMYDKNNLTSKQNVLDTYLPIIDEINLTRNAKTKIHVSIIGNKDDLGGKHTFRNTCFKSFDTRVNLFSMSLRNENIIDYGNNISSWWKNSEEIKHDDLTRPIRKLIV